jgi:PepSY-associated TM region
MLVTLHRYLGISAGLLMVLWCLSGIVMIYEPFPGVDEARRLRGLEDIDWTAAASLLPKLRSDRRYERVQVEMLAGVPVLRVWPSDGPMELIQVGAAPGRMIDASEALHAAVSYAGPQPGGEIWIPRADVIEYDQWTVALASAGRPFHRVAVGDAAGTLVYVSSTTGTVVQAATRAQRFWGWLGAVPHWLYPSILRSRPGLWSQVIIWTSLIGVLLTVAGGVLGVQASLMCRSRSHWSPFRGLALWHHGFGLAFGLFALTWVLSGLLSVNPWGLMEGRDLTSVRHNLAGTPPTGAEVASALAALAAKRPDGIKSLDSAPLGGELHLVATRTSGSRIRYDAAGETRALGRAEISAAAVRVAGSAATWTILNHEDAYYYAMPGERAALPVIRAQAPNGDLYYLDARSAALLDRAEAGERAYRWWHSGLHRLDLSTWLRTTLGRSLVMLPLLVGTSILAILGAYTGLRRYLRPSS